MWDSQRRHVSRPARALAFALVLLAAACSGSDGSTTAEDEPGNGNARAVGSASSPVAEYDPSSTSPPAIVLQRGDSQLSLMAFTYCWSAEDSEDGICSDGAPPTEPEVLDGSGPIELYFPFDDYDFESRFWDVTYTDELPGPSLTKVGDHWELDPPDELPAIIEVFGFNLDSDVIVSFRVEN